MRKYFLTATALCSIVLLQAQKKSISYEQAFKGVATNILQTTPGFGRWTDDEHYTETKKDDADGQVKTFLTDAKTGKTAVYPAQAEEKTGA